MHRHKLSATVLVLLAGAALSCAAPQPRVSSPAPGEAPAPSGPAPTAVAPVSIPPALPEPVPAAEGGPIAEIRLAPTGPSLTETLDKALDMLTSERARSEQLSADIARLELLASEKSAIIEELTAKIQLSDTRAKGLEQSLELWNDDVLGFRDEMRRAEEAELAVLQEILLLLKDFAVEKGLE